MPTLRLTSQFNVVNMFVAYHILRAGMPVDRIVYERNAQTTESWNFCFGYEPQEYFETMLPNTLLKVWQTNPKSSKELWLNRYWTNNTLTSRLGLCCLGDRNDEDHTLVFKGVPVDRDGSEETLNGFIHRIKGILKYDEIAKAALHERLRFDSSTSSTSSSTTASSTSSTMWSWTTSLSPYPTSSSGKTRST